jgi:hypothetical protein
VKLSEPVKILVDDKMFEPLYFAESLEKNGIGTPISIP